MTGKKRKKQLSKDPADKGVSQERSTRALVRLQDKALQEMKDDGLCLSMHQPWATLLIAGIKRYS